MYFHYDKIRVFLELSDKLVLTKFDADLLTVARQDMGRSDPVKYIRLFREMANYRHYRAINPDSYEKDYLSKR